MTVFLTWNVDLFKKMGLYDGKVAQGVVWLIFVALAVGVIFSSIYMSQYLIAYTARRNIGQSIAGGLFLAIITSLPEATIAFTSGATDFPQLSLANTAGSNAYYMFLFALASIIFAKYKKFTRVGVFQRSLLVQATIFIVILFLAFLPGTFTSGAKPGLTFLSWTIPGIKISWLWLAFFLSYIIVVTILIVRNNRKQKLNQQFILPEEQDEITEKEYKHHMGVKKILILFILLSSVLIILAFLLSITADVVPHVYGIPETSVGGLLLSFVTNCPETSTTFILIKQKKRNLAFGSLAGSLNFNIIINFFADLAFKKTGSLEYVTQFDTQYPQYAMLMFMQLILVTLTFMTITIKVQSNKHTYIGINAMILAIFVALWVVILTVL